ncbi:Hypothetical protein CINCED_3A005693 [Cinara cedri]|uniref:Uncharacterized protein n=1 Tax=Cinara cedri TaxID=506608 RepID=A0A5E4MWN3_9HEMI|nr:Hypothetical protein CINCED_3A005693 [Cinara cedri]
MPDLGQEREKMWLVPFFNNYRHPITNDFRYDVKASYEYPCLDLRFVHGPGHIIAIHITVTDSPLDISQS